MSHQATDSDAHCDAPGCVVASASVADALKLFVDSSLSCAVVVDGGHPVGVVTGAALRSMAERSQEVTVLEAMDYETVHIEPTSNVEETMRAFRTAAWHSLWRRRPFAATR